tara:strand:+ start:425 stop:1042 length:618 start_codon:yes stop_codon:yes gene_type:complete
MDLSVKPSNLIETREKQEDTILEVNKGDKNKADIPLPPPKESVDVFEAPVRKTLTRMKKQRETIAKTKQRLTLKEKRLELKKQKDEIKAQKLRIKEAEAEYKRTHPRKTIVKKTQPKPNPKPKQVAPKVEQPKPRSTSIPKRAVGIKGLTEDEIQTLYGVFSKAQAQQTQQQAELRPKPKPKPTITFYNPIETHAFTHLNNPFNF